jgi:hypothetical protein
LDLPLSGHLWWANCLIMPHLWQAVNNTWLRINDVRYKSMPCV